MILNVSSLVYKKKNLYKLLYLGVTLEWYYRGALKIKIFKKVKILADFFYKISV